MNYLRPEFDMKIKHFWDEQFVRECYTEPDCFSVGDYGGSGTVGAANLRWLDEVLGEGDPSLDATTLHEQYVNYGDFDGQTFGSLPVIIHQTGAFSSQWVHLRRDFADAHDSELDDLATRTVEAHEIEVLDGALADALAEVVRGIRAAENHPIVNDEVLAEVEMAWQEAYWNDFSTHDLSAWCRSDSVLSAFDEGILPKEVVAQALHDEGGWFDYDYTSASASLAERDRDDFTANLRDWLDKNVSNWVGKLVALGADIDEDDEDYEDDDTDYEE